MGAAEVKFSKGETLDGTLLPAVVSDPIDDVSTEQFWEMLENFIKDRKPITSGYEEDYKCTPMEDGGLLAYSFFKASGLSTVVVGNISGTAHVKYYIKKDENLMVSYTYANDPEMSEDNLAVVAYLKAYADPLRLEFYQDMKPWRAHGPVLKSMVDTLLKKGGIEDVEVLVAQPSPSEEGKKSVLSGPLPEGTTIEKLFEFDQQQARDNYGTDLPDGSILVEQEGILSTVYYTISLSEDKTTILQREFGDSTLQQHRATVFKRLAQDPLRLEVWSEHIESREAGQAEKNIIEPFVQRIFKFAKGKPYDV